MEMPFSTFSPKQDQPIQNEPESFSQDSNTQNTPENIFSKEGKHPKKSKLLPIIIFIGVFLLLGAAGAFGYFYFFKQVDYEDILFQSLENTKKLRSYSEEDEFEIRVPFDPEFIAKNSSPFISVPKELIIRLKISAKSDLTKIDSPKFSGTLNLEVPMSEIPFLGQISVSPQLSLIKLDKNDAYFRFDSLPSFFFFDFNKVQGKWVRINFQELYEKYGWKIEQTQDETKKYSKAMGDIYKIFKTSGVLQIQKAIVENYKDQKAYHLIISLNKENTKKFLKDVIDYIQKEFSVELEKEMTKEYQKEIDDFMKEIDEVLSDIEFSGDVWITKKDLFYRKARFELKTIIKDITGDLSLNKDPKSISGAQQGETIGKLIITLKSELSNINQPISITKPESSITLEEYIQSWQEIFNKTMNFGSSEFMQPTTLDLPVSESGLDTDSDGDGLTDYSEKFYGSDPYSTDSDNDGFSDGHEVENGYNPAGTGKL